MRNLNNLLEELLRLIIAGALIALLCFTVMVLVVEGAKHIGKENRIKALKQEQAYKKAIYKDKIKGQTKLLHTKVYDYATIVKYAKMYGVDPLLVASIQIHESHGDPNALSSSGAIGLMQVMPFHARGSENLFNPDTNVMVACRLLGWLRGQFKGTTDHLSNADGTELMVAWYNGGYKQANIRDNDKRCFETKYYVKRVMNSYTYLKRKEGKK